MAKERRNFFRNLYLQMHFLKRSGFYDVVGKSLLKFTLIVVLVLVALYVIGNEVLNIPAIFDYLTHSVSYYWIFLLFYVSESLFSFVPPDLFIVWCDGLHHPWIILTILGFLSFLGGVNSYFLGRFIRKNPRINGWFVQKFDIYVKNSRKWGGWLIAAAALTPLPYSMTMVCVGLIKYPFKNLIFWSLIRIPRFHLYALLIFSAVNF